MGGIGRFCSNCKFAKTIFFLIPLSVYIVHEYVLIEIVLSYLCTRVHPPISGPGSVVNRRNYNITGTGYSISSDINTLSNNVALDTIEWDEIIGPSI